MEHKFNPSQLDSTKCVVCRHSFVDHTDMATCEACSNSGNMELYPNMRDENAMLLCTECISKEKEYQSPAKQDARLQEHREHEASSGILDISNLVDRARTLDYAVQIRTDIFNAETVATQQVFAAIDANTEIPAAQKQFEKAKFLTERYETFKKAIFGLQEELVTTQNKQRVIQQELNQIANTLRAEEREKLKILSPEYKPGAVKSPKETKTRTKKPTFDKKELLAEAKILQDAGLPVQWNMLQMTCVARNMTPKQAAEFMRKTMTGGV